MSLNRSLLSAITKDLEKKKKPSKPKVKNIAIPPVPTYAVGPRFDQGGETVVDVEHQGDDRMKKSLPYKIFVKGLEAADNAITGTGKYLGDKLARFAPSHDQLSQAQREQIFNDYRPVEYPGMITAGVNLVKNTMGWGEKKKPMMDPDGDYDIGEEAWRKALGLSTKGKYIQRSKYKPGTATDPNVQYYRVNRNVIDPQKFIDYVKSGEFDKRKQRTKNGKNEYVQMSSMAPFLRDGYMPEDEYSQIDPVQRFQIYRGYDEKKKMPYVSYADTYDFNFAPMNKMIKPYEFYDRFYYYPKKHGGTTYSGGLWYRPGGETVAYADNTRVGNVARFAAPKKGQDQPWSSLLDRSVGAPQRGMVKLFTGKDQYPSEAMGLKNPLAAFVADAVLDPSNLAAGAGIASKLYKGAKAASTKQVLKNINKKILADHLPVPEKSPAEVIMANRDYIESALRDRAEYFASLGKADPDAWVPHGVINSDGMVITNLASMPDQANFNYNNIFNKPSKTQKLAQKFNQFKNTIGKAAENIDYGLGSLIKKPKSLPEGLTLEDLNRQVNEELAKGVGVKKTNTPLQVQLDGDLDRMLVRTQYIDEAGDLQDMGNIALRRQMNPYRGKKLSELILPPVQSYTPKQMWSNTLGYAKTSDFPYNLVGVDKFQQSGISGEFNKAVNEVLKRNKLGSILSGGTGHTLAGKDRWENLVSKGLADDLGDNLHFILKKHGGSTYSGGLLFDEGGEKEEVQDAKNFVTSWNNSPMAQQMLANSVDQDDPYGFNSAHTEAISDLRNKLIGQAKVNVVRPIDIINRYKFKHPKENVSGVVGYSSNGSSYSTLGSMLGSLKNPSNYFNNMDSSYSKYMSALADEIEPGKVVVHNGKDKHNVDETLVHELSHASDYGGYYMPNSDIDKIKQYSKSGAKNKFTRYIAEPTETRARLMNLRYNAKNQGIYDPFTQKISEEQLKKYNIGNHPGYDPLDQLRKVYTDKQITDMLNTISYNDQGQVSDTGYARYGGNPYFAEGGEYTGSSIVDYLQTKGFSGSKQFRKELAKQMGIDNYKFTAEQNLEMLRRLRENDDYITDRSREFTPVPVEKIEQMEKQAKAYYPSYTPAPPVQMVEGEADMNAPVPVPVRKNAPVPVVSKKAPAQQMYPNVTPFDPRFGFFGPRNPSMFKVQPQVKEQKVVELPAPRKVGDIGRNAIKTVSGAVTGINKLGEMYNEATSKLSELAEQASYAPEWLVRQYEKFVKPEGKVKSAAIGKVPVIKKPNKPFSLTGDQAMIGSDTLDVGNLPRSMEHYYTNSAIVDLNKVKTGYRNRGDYTQIPNLEGNVLNPWMSPSQMKDNQMYIGVDKAGRFLTGKKAELKNAVSVSEVPYANATDIGNDVYLDQNYKFMTLKNNGNPEHFLNVSLGKDGSPDANDRFGGGATIIETPDKKQRYFVRGSVNQVKKAFNDLKKNTGHKNLNVYILDNGSYNTGLKTKDGISTAEELRSYERKNNAGSHGFYFKQEQGGEMIKRADGSYSRRGLWDNIRANRGSGKAPTKEMLEQERKIRAAEKQYGGMVDAYFAKGGQPDGDMALTQINGVIAKLDKLRQFIKPETDLEPWESSKFAVMDHYADALFDNMMYSPENEEQMAQMQMMAEGGIPERYRNMGFTRVGAKKNSTRPGKKWMVLAKKGDDYKVVHGGYDGMKDYTQHGSENRRERFWDRMGGRNSAKAKDPFSPLYWHKRFGTWKDGGSTFSGNVWYAGGGTANPFLPQLDGEGVLAQVTAENAVNPMSAIQDLGKKAPSSLDKFNSTLGRINNRLAAEMVNPYSLTNSVRLVGDMIDGFNNRRDYNDALDKQRMNYSTDQAYHTTISNGSNRGNYDMYNTFRPNMIGGNMSYAGMNQPYFIPKPFAEGGQYETSSLSWIPKELEMSTEVPFFVAAPKANTFEMAPTKGASPEMNKFTKMDFQLSNNFDNYAQKAQKYLDKVAPGTDISGLDLAAAAQQAYQKHGEIVPVELALAQLTQEGYLAKGKKPNKPQRTKNPFNVGNTDSGATVTHNSVFDGILSYYDLMASQYLKGKSPQELLQNFTNRKGNRYASDKRYEDSLKKIISGMKMREGGEYELTEDQIMQIRAMGGEVEYI